MDGILAPTLPTDEWRQMFLETVESVSNEAAFRDEEDEDDDFHIPICHDLGHFIKYANGVDDPDFRKSGISEFRPVPFIGFEEYAFKDHPAVLAMPAPDITSHREILRSDLLESLCDEAFIEGIIDEDLEVKVGFRTGTGCHREHPRWHSAYLYCRRYVEDSDPSHKDWAWRVVVFHADGDNPTELYGRKPRFNSIVEFLDWYSS